MFRLRIFWGLGLAVALALTLGAGSASADTQYTLSVENSDLQGPPGPFPGPYGTVNVALDATHTVATITFNFATTGGFTYLFQSNEAADVNVNAASFTPAFVSATNVFNVSGSGFVNPAPTANRFSINSNNSVGGFGRFNLTFDLFDGTHQPASQVVYTLTNGTNGGWANDASVLTPNEGNFFAAAHIVLFNSGNVNNGQQLATGFVATPEPSSMAIAGLGALGFVGYGLRRRLKK